jgi:hypothetical protein
MGMASAAKISLLYMGDPFGASPYFALSREPGIELYPVPAFTMANSYPRELGPRIMRSYFPRTSGGVAGFDGIILSDVRMDLLTDNHLLWIFRAVVNNGTGVAMIGGLDSFAGVGDGSWYDTPVGDILPVLGGNPVWSTAWLRWVDEEDEVIAGLPLGSLLDRPLFAGFNDVEGKQGSDTIAVISSGSGTSPLMTYWEVGRGFVFSMASEWKGDTYASYCRTPEECHLRGTRWGNEFASWEFSPDLVRSIVHAVSGEVVFPDAEASRLFGSKSREFGLAKSLALLQMEFIDKLGIPVTKVEALMSRADTLAKEATESYIEGEFEEALGGMDLAIETLSRAGPVASRLKSRSLPWVHLGIYAMGLGILLLAGIVTEITISRGVGGVRE